MDWRGQRESDNVEDRRGGGGIKAAGFLGGGGIIIAIIYTLLGGDPRVILSQLGQNQANTSTAPAGATASNQDPDSGASAGSSNTAAGKPPAEDAGKSFVRVVLAETEDVWGAEFTKEGRTYEKPKVVLYSDRVNSACGLASSAVGPFYCPSDAKVYLDLAFFRDLHERLGAQGEFAQAYVIAHEIGHHVQNLLGLTNSERGAGRANDNQRSVGIELQADCFAGVWAKRTADTSHVIEHGDIDSALSAAAAVGDDRLQREAGKAVAPDAFTHGSSAQRVAAFKQGYSAGNPQDCRSLNVAH